MGYIFKDAEFEFCLSCTVLFANLFYVDWIAGVTHLYLRRMNKTHIFFIYIQGRLWQTVQCLQMCWFNKRNLVWLHLASAISWISCNARVAGLLARFFPDGKILNHSLSFLLVSKHYSRSTKSIHVVNFFIIKPTRCTNLTNLFWHEILHVSDGSSVHHQEFIHCTLRNGICHTCL
jgi:hypothetical protein